MKPKIHNTGEFRIVLLLALLAIFPPVPTLQAQSPAQSGNDGLLHAFAQSQGRFIENVGQYPQDIRFVASGAEGWMLFFDDRVEYRRSTSHPCEGKEDEYTDSTIPFMSRKMRHPADFQAPVCRNVHTDTIMLFDSAVSPEGRGLRTERINYFGSTGTCGSVRNAPTWDTLLYSGKGQTVSIFFDRGHAVFEGAGNSKNQSHPFVWESAIDDHFGRTPIPEAGGITNVPLSNIVYSTYLGGSDADAIATAIPLGENRFILIGTTGSIDFPILGNAYSTNLQGDPSSKYSRDVFITCLDIQRNEILFSTYFGGWDLESLMAATIDASGNIVFAGSTWSDDLPVTPNAWQPQYRGNGDGYIAALNATGSELVFCSYIGGTGIENLKDMKIDAHGNIVITGLTDSWNYPTTPGVVQSSYGGGEDDIFVTKFNHDVSEMIFSTFIGGRGWDEGRSLRFTPEGNILVAGYTNSNDFPVTEDALYGNRHAYDEGCVFILTPGGRRLVYSTYIAWNTYEDAWAAYLDDDGLMTVFGLTTSTDLPVSENAFQIEKGDAPEFNPYIADFYVLKYRLDSGEILACTYLGGSGSERYPNSLIPMPDGAFLVSGSGNSGDYPLTEGAPMSLHGIYSAKISFLSSDLSTLLMSTEIGGQGNTHILNLFVLDRNLILAGLSYADDFPTTVDSYQSKMKGEVDAFFTILDLSSVLSGLGTSAVLPEAAVLSQHYPNPVHGETTIPFTLPRPGHVRLAIHDMIGREVLSVLDRQLDAGDHQVTVSLGHLSPGTYFFRLLTATGLQSRMLHVF